MPVFQSIGFLRMCGSSIGNRPCCETEIKKDPRRLHSRLVSEMNIQSILNDSFNSI